MKHGDFSIGMQFMTDSGRWRCTDIGTRTIAAIKISEASVTTRAADGTMTTRTECSPDPSWFHGPPYAVAEQVFDEDALTACRKAGP